MQHDAKPNLGDVFIGVREEGERMLVALHLRTGGPKLNVTVEEWGAREFEVMFGKDALRVASAREPKVDYDDLRRRVLAHAAKNETGPLVRFETEILEAMTLAHKLLPDVHDELFETDPPTEDHDIVQSAAALALERADFPAMCSARLHEVHSHLQGVLEDILDLRHTPDPVMTNASPNEGSPSPTCTVEIVPAGPLRGVMTIPAIVALRTHAPLGLKEAKAAVETMVSRGRCTLDLGDLARRLKEPAMADEARVLDEALLASGVRLLLDGCHLDLTPGDDTETSPEESPGHPR